LRASGSERRHVSCLLNIVDGRMFPGPCAIELAQHCDQQQACRARSPGCDRQAFPPKANASIRRIP
jgi:hypothetical protein